MKKQTPDEIEKIQQAILDREVEEELQKERLINFWNKYRFLIIGGVVAVIVSVAGTQGYHSWYSKVRLKESNIFENAAVLNVSGKQEEALKNLNTLSSTAKTDYKYLAELKKAGIYLSQNSKEEALKTLKALSEAKSAPEALKSVALLSYVGHQIESGNADELQALLTPLLEAKNAYFLPATELKVAILLKQNKKEEAKKTLQEAALNPNLTPNATERINTLLSAI